MLSSGEGNFFPKWFLNLNEFDFRPFNFCHLLSLVYSFIVERKTVKCLRRMKDLRKKGSAHAFEFFDARARLQYFLRKKVACVRAHNQRGFVASTPTLTLSNWN